jgi:hypothetical protein
MSNDVTGNPLIIDTTSVTPITLRRLEITSIRWQSTAASAGHTCVVHSSNNRVIWSSVATGSNYVEAEHWSVEAPLVADGLTVATLSSGTLYITVRNFIGVM